MYEESFFTFSSSFFTSVFESDVFSWFCVSSLFSEVSVFSVFSLFSVSSSTSNISFLIYPVNSEYLTLYQSPSFSIISTFSFNDATVKISESVFASFLIRTVS